MDWVSKGRRREEGLVCWEVLSVEYWNREWKGRRGIRSGGLGGVMMG